MNPCPHPTWRAMLWPPPSAYLVPEKSKQTAEECQTLFTCERCGQQKIGWSIVDVQWRWPTKKASTVLEDIAKSRGADKPSTPFRSFA